MPQTYFSKNPFSGQEYSGIKFSLDKLFTLVCGKLVRGGVFCTEVGPVSGSFCSVTPVGRSNQHPQRVQVQSALFMRHRNHVLSV